MDFCRGYSVEKQLIEAYEDYTTYLFLSPSTLLHNREAKGNNRSFSKCILWMSTQRMRRGKR